MQAFSGRVEDNLGRFIHSFINLKQQVETKIHIFWDIFRNCNVGRFAYDYYCLTTVHGKIAALTSGDSEMMKLEFQHVTTKMTGKGTTTAIHVNVDLTITYQQRHPIKHKAKY